MDDLWNQAWDSLIQEVQREANEEAAAAAAIPHEIRHRRTIPRDHVGAAERLMADYFSADPRYPAEIFRRRFRMSRPLFTHIATTLTDRFECFTLRSDCTGRIGLSTLHKCTSAIRQLAYAGPADMFDEYLQMGSNNDINVLQSSPIFNDECRGEGPEISFVANGTQYRRGYYLANGIYPRWPVFVKTLRQPLERRDNILRENKRPLGKMLSELLVCSKRDGPFYAARHECGTDKANFMHWLYSEKHHISAGSNMFD
ncbi:uncharacterized protein LOC125195251 [Salvia hispanica]|uniref:uncharacterized protein LOC125195251 n=1 Tax=Salvia hispanica TaxID=49212 RepID=UPI0020096C7F|nr:uncharacterized protein LOC125195251 [Salvia hispanica]